jgi:hypothetical protein
MAEVDATARSWARARLVGACGTALGTAVWMEEPCLLNAALYGSAALHSGRIGNVLLCG